ncbi:hypothetical protein NEOLI_001611 [Neolecta irregularis DAH-3]|uniref:Uncharacterized protein n=1 Tax=Neolecta irregularis (strain DAH-3) TaxID=1198029 RepID=A0A1U7LR30_NEOID|nr:hypothetical protein NEOLI_001611 [Neolecta irregularis DAH-3]|eukprot:OLL25089.1 hypothetical protein NEOLI_001611 [Neolecta irregularis DAH-3]
MSEVSRSAFESPFDPISYISLALPSQLTTPHSAQSLLSELTLLEGKTQDDLAVLLDSSVPLIPRLPADLETLVSTASSLSTSLETLQQPQCESLERLKILAQIRENIVKTVGVFETGLRIDQELERIEFLKQSREFEKAQEAKTKLRRVVDIWKGTREEKERRAKVE